MKPIAIALQAMFGTVVLLGCATTLRPNVEVKPLMQVKHGGVEEAQGYYELGRLHRENARSKEAERAFREAIARDDAMAEAHSALGALYAARGDFAKAMPALERAVSLSPRDARFRNNLGYAFYLQGRFADAIAAYEASLAIDPRNPRMWNNLGLALAQAGDVPRAEAAYARASSIEAGPALAKAPPDAMRAEVPRPSVHPGAAPADAAPPADAVAAAPMPFAAGTTAAWTPPAGPPSPDSAPPMLVPIAEIATPSPSPSSASLLMPVVSPLTPMTLLPVSELAHAFRQPVVAAATDRALEPMPAATGTAEPFVPSVAVGDVRAAALGTLEEWKPSALAQAFEPARQDPTATLGVLVPADPVSSEAIAMFEPLPTLDASLSATLAPPALPAVALLEPVVAVAATDSAPLTLLPPLGVPLQPATAPSDPARRLGSMIVEVPAAAQVVVVAPNAFELRYHGTTVVARADSAAPVSVVATRARFEISNGNGVTGMARMVDGQLRAAGLPKSRLTNQKPFTQRATEIRYRAGREDDAAALAARFPRPPALVRDDKLRSGVDVRLVLGRDLPRDLALVDPAGDRRQAAVGAALATEMNAPRTRRFPRTAAPSGDRESPNE